MGDFSGGRFYWPFSSVHALKSPIEVRGRQGIWTLDEATERLIYEQLPTEWHAKAIRAEERA